MISKTHENELDLMFLAKAVEDNSVLAGTKLTHNHFKDVITKIVFSIGLRAIQEKNCFLPLVDLKPLFEDSERLEKIALYEHSIKLSSVENLMEEIMKRKSDKTANSLEQTILERYTREKLFIVSNGLSNDLKDSSKSTRELLRRYSYSLDVLMNDSASTRRTLTSEDLLKTEINFLNSPKVERFPSTGLPIDIENDGLNAPSLTVILGGPKAGKSTFLYNSAINSLKQGRTILFVTIEIPNEECYRKIMSIYSQVPYQKIKTNDLDEEEKKFYLSAVKTFSEQYKDKVFIIDDSKGVSSKDIKVYVDQLAKAGIIIDDIYADYMLIMSSNNPNIPKVEALTAISTELRQLSQATNTRVFTAQQLSSKASTKDISEITFDDIYFCKNLSHEATYSIVIENTRSPDNKSLLKTMFLPSRQQWSPTIRYYPNFNQDTITLGECEDYAKEDITEAYVEDYISCTLNNIF